MQNVLGVLTTFCIIQPGGCMFTLLGRWGGGHDTMEPQVTFLSAEAAVRDNGVPVSVLVA